MSLMTVNNSCDSERRIFTLFVQPIKSKSLTTINYIKPSHI